MVYPPLPGGAQLCEQVLMRFALVRVYDSQVLFIYVHCFLYVSYWKGSTTSSAALLREDRRRMILVRFVLERIHYVECFAVVRGRAAVAPRGWRCCPP